MDDLMSEFLTETAENLAVLDVELVKFERDPIDTDTLENIFRLVHTIKGEPAGFSTSRGSRRCNAVDHLPLDQPRQRSAEMPFEWVAIESPRSPRSGDVGLVGT